MKSPIVPFVGAVFSTDFRKTFASMHRDAGVDLHTIQRWLRHAKLERTVQYLADSEDQSAVIRPLRMRRALSTLVKRKGNPVLRRRSRRSSLHAGAFARIDVEGESEIFPPTQFLGGHGSSDVSWVF
ncbi:MAG TPA: hypothetical protein VGI45_10760 [Terracidiphilus sp.]